MKTNTKIYIALAVLLTIAGIIMYLKQKKKQKEQSGEKEQEENAKNKEIKYMDELLDKKFKKDEFPLKIGSVGKNVEQLQRYLKDKIGAKVTVNGILDEKTLANVKGFLKMDEVSQDSFKKLRMSDFKTFGNYTG